MADHVHAELLARPGEFTAGIATAVEKDFHGVNHLYTGSADGAEDSDVPAAPPAFGGTPVGSEDGPPFLILTPLQVSQATAFLEAASFDELWAASKDGIFTPLRGHLYEVEARDFFLQHHTDLHAFHRQAAGAGHSVVKAFRYWAPALPGTRARRRHRTHLRRV
ncbi:DUF1877 family protein [Kitasatospora sp. NPDC092948]|uniref:DUF1877 family protein n=1 Tax=Kitasatospora sp. NPDC092948 TaxID=3364088 RepID=UPI0037F6F3B5